MHNHTMKQPESQKGRKHFEGRRTLYHSQSKRPSPSGRRVAQSLIFADEPRMGVPRPSRSLRRAGTGQLAL